ncbi:PucR family transcriptional regulator [Rugosimonospora acidiphila]|uniref:PucR family transcriptional regulator n=1 Tax=Rugosimonospora acidiphila TaxID=556531 RepID=UPI0031EDABE1
MQGNTDSHWFPVVALCRALEDGFIPFVTQVIDHIRADDPAAYASVPRGEHEASFGEQYRSLLTGMVARRPPNAAEIDRARALGRRRAGQGLPAELMIRAYQRSYRDFWARVAGRGLDEPAQAPVLLELGDLVWTWLQAITCAVVEGYAETARSRNEIRIGFGQQFLDALYSGRAGAEETGCLARALGFDPDGSFQAICCPAGSMTPERVDRLRRRSHDNGALVMVRGAVVVIVCQGLPEPEVVQLLADCDAQPTAGLGLLRSGLAGAAESIVDAERALSVAQNGPPGKVVRFSSSWLLATLFPQSGRLRPLLDPGKAISQRHLGEAVRAFADHGFSITASADALHVHPNTVKYRLDRWQHLTGWNPRTIDGLQRSLLSIALAERQPEVAAGAPQDGS